MTALWIGVEAPPSDGEIYEQAFTRVNSEIGPARIYRAYLQDMPWPSYSSGANLSWIQADGAHPFVSLTPAPSKLADVAAGVYDSQLTAFIQSFPVGWRWYLTLNHEPEAPSKGIDPADWVAAIAHVHSLAHSVSSDVLVGPVHMTYQWGTGNNVDATGGPSAWTVPAADVDFYGTDTYEDAVANNGVGPRRFADDPRHMRWHNNFQPLGKPLHVVEHGQDHTDGTDSQIEQILLDEETWLEANGYELWCYWQKQGGIEELNSTDTPLSKAAWQQIASRGATDTMTGPTAAIFADSGGTAGSSVSGTLLTWVAGDRVYVGVWVGADATVTVTPSAGWTQVGSAVSASSSWTMWLFVRQMQSGDADPTFTLSAGRVYRAIGVNAGAGWVGEESVGSGTGTTAAMTSGATTPSAASETSLVIYGYRNTDGTAPSYTDDPNLTRDATLDLVTSTSPAGHFYVGHGSPADGVATSYSVSTSQTMGFYTGVALSLIPAVTVDRYVTYTDGVPVTGDVQYTLSAWVKAGADGLFTGAQLELLWYDSSDVLLSTDSGGVASINSSGWTEVSIVVTAPANAVKADLQIHFTPDPGASAAAAYVDDVTMYVGTAVPAGSTWTVERSTDQTRWTTVRGGGEADVDAGALPLDDYEFDENVQNLYRIRVFDAGALFWTFRDQITVVLDRPWLKSISFPFLNQALAKVAAAEPVTRAARVGIFNVVGRSLPVAVTDVRGSAQFNLTVATTTPGEQESLQAMFAPGDVVLLQVPPTAAPGPATRYPIPGGYYCVGDVVEDRRDMPWDRRWWTLPLTEVTAPAASITGASITWRGLGNRYAQWSDVIADNLSWRDVLELRGTPADVVIP